MNKEQVYKYIKSKNIWYEIKEHKTFFKRKIIKFIVSVMMIVDCY